MKITFWFLGPLVFSLVGCASPIATPVANSQRNFQLYVQQYLEMPEPKAMYSAQGGNAGWAAGISINAKGIPDARDQARVQCEKSRITQRINAPCLPHYENGQFVRHSPQQRAAQQTRRATSSPPASVSGTCFNVHPSGEIITAQHVVEGRSNIEVIFPNGERFNAQVASASQRLDVAVLKVDARSLAYIPIAPTRSYASGDYIFVLGYPVRSILGDEVKFTDGSISALSGIQREGAFMQISAPVQPGNSGGPVISERGEVVGVLASTIAVERFISDMGTLPQNINWATNIDFVRPLLSSVPASSPLRDRRAAIDRAKAATCIIEAR